MSGEGGHLALVRRRGPELMAFGVRRLSGTSPGDLVGRPQVVGLCGTDLQILRGLRDDPARVLGHEGVVRIDEGEGPRGRFLLNPTSRDPLRPMPGHTIDGLMQQRMQIPEALRGALLPVPALLDDELAVLAEPLGAVALALRAIAGCAPPRRLLVIGRGTAGRLFALAARALCPTIEAVRLVGSTCTIRDRRYDAAVVCGARDQACAGVALALARLAPDGVLHLFGGLPEGFLHPDLPLVDAAAVRARNTAKLGQGAAGVLTGRTDGSRLWVTGSRGASEADLRAAMAELIRAPDRYRPLLRIEADPEGFLAAIREAVATGRRNWAKLAIDLRDWHA